LVDINSWHPICQEKTILTIYSGLGVILLKYFITG
jgi:hypothetical protein